jgi:hypothetical protein
MRETAPAAAADRVQKHIEALADKKRRERAKSYLIRYYSERGRDALETAVRNHSDPMVRAQLTYVVARIGGEWGYRMLHTLLNDPAEEVRYDAATFHRFFPTESTARALRDYIEGVADADTAKAAAFHALKAIGEPARAVLEELARHPNAQTVEYARFNLTLRTDEDEG